MILFCCLIEDTYKLAGSVGKLSDTNAKETKGIFKLSRDAFYNGFRGVETKDRHLISSRQSAKFELYILLALEVLPLSVVQSRGIF